MHGQEIQQEEWSSYKTLEEQVPGVSINVKKYTGNSVIIFFFPGVGWVFGVLQDFKGLKKYYPRLRIIRQPYVEKPQRKIADRRGFFA